MSEATAGRGARLLAVADRWGGAVVALLVALPLRAPGLGEWWLNPDEGIYYSILTRSGAAGFWSEVVANAHPPLYYLLLRALGFLTWDFLWFRAFSLVCGLLAVQAMWLAASELCGRGWRGVAGGLVGALVLALAPGAIDLSQVMRPYTLQLALLSGALWLLLRYLRTASPRALAGYVGLLCLALLTHYSSVLALVPLAALVAHDAVARGAGREAWRRLALLHALPLLLVVGLYLLHLRPLMASQLADEALDGWLSFYMVGSPAQAWLAFMGFQNLLAAPWLRGPMAVLFLAGVALSAASGDRRPLVLGVAGLASALVGAAAGVYPMGATRHVLWLMAFTVPVIGWLAATLAFQPLRRLVPAAVAVGVLLAAGDPAGRWLGRLQAPWAPTERVLAWDDLVGMVDLLDPEGRPRLVLMSGQTFYLLLPFYPREREEATFAGDSSVFHFRLGERDVVATRAWDFTAGPGQGEPGSHLAEILDVADSAFAGVDLERDSLALLLVGGWSPPFVRDLVELSSDDPFLMGQRRVPGFGALLLDVPAYRRAAAGGLP